MTEEEVAGLIRAGRFEDAERVLADELRAHPGAIATACLAVPPDGVEVIGWDALDAELTRLVRRGHPISAVGLDLSNYHDSDTDDWWDKDPCVEVTVYSDADFPFSTSELDEVLRACETYPAPWTGGGLVDVDVHPGTRGLRGVNGAVLRDAEAGGLDGARPIGWWWQHLRFRQAVARHLAERGLALLVPVLAGSHDVGPWLVTAHPVARVSDHLETTERLLAERDRVNLERFDAITEETVRELVDLRQDARGWGRFNRDKRKLYVELADARLALLCSAAGLPAPPASIARIGDREFDALIEAYVAHRTARAEESRPNDG